MGGRIAQIVFEKIKTPEIKEVKILEVTERGDDGFGSTGMHTMQQMNEKKTNEDMKHVNEEYSRSRGSSCITSVIQSRPSRPNNE